MSFSKTEVHGAEAVIRAAMLEAEGGGSIAIIARDPDHMRHLAEAVQACAPDWFKPQVSMTKRRIDFPSGAQVHLSHHGEPDRVRGMNLGFAWWWGPAGTAGWAVLAFAMRLGSQTVLATQPGAASTWRFGEVLPNWAYATISGQSWVR